MAITVRRQNVILKVDEADKQHYLNIGFQVIDEQGNVIEDNNPDYKTLYFEQKQKVEELEAKLQKLTAKKEEPKSDEEPKKRTTRKAKA